MTADKSQVILRAACGKEVEMITAYIKTWCFSRPLALRVYCTIPVTIPVVVNIVKIACSMKTSCLDRKHPSTEAAVSG